MVIQMLILGILMFIIPVMAGGLFCKVEKGFDRLLFMWISGQIVLWAGFQCICVPMILCQGAFVHVKWLFLGFMGILAVAGAVKFCLEGKKNGYFGRRLKLVKPYQKWGKVLWVVFAILLLLQLILTGVLAYEEGDDAFYVAISTITVDAENMYTKLPYTGAATGLDARHGLAPFPIWIAFLASLSGVHAVTVAHIAVPIVLILMAYAIYYLVGSQLLEGRKEYLSLFMIILEVIILFGGYSVYSAENFLLVRTSQGKAVLANIVIPVLFLLFMLLLNRIQQKEKTGTTWFLLASSMIVACLCSTLGALLVCVLLGIVGLCIVVCYRRWKALFAIAACCLFPVCVAALYFVLD